MEAGPLLGLGAEVKLGVLFRSLGDLVVHLVMLLQSRLISCIFQNHRGFALRGPKERTCADWRPRSFGRSGIPPQESLPKKKLGVLDSLERMNE